MRLPNINSLSALIDRLSIENIRIALMEENKVQEHLKTNPNVNKIAEWDKISRKAVELRSRIKREIDKCFEEAIENRKYEYLGEVRAFDPVKVADLVDLIDERYQVIATRGAKGDLLELLNSVL